FGSGLSQRGIARSLSISCSTVCEMVYRARAAGLDLERLATLNDRQLDALIYPSASGRPQKRSLKFEYIHSELKRKGWMLSDLTTDVYNLLAPLRRFDHAFVPSHLPSSGIYFFYEKGETIRLGGLAVDRIVRVGINRSNGRFRSRIRGHYGRVSRLGGNKNGSVFRKHLGGALLRRADPADPRLTGWLQQDGPTYAEVEREVSLVLRHNLTFACVRVEDADERKNLESALIALLAQEPLGQPSPAWLGAYAASEDIRNLGLWNTQHIHSEPLTLEAFGRLSALASDWLRCQGG
ncbi:MAG: hypothetical protein Q8P50_12280, partial [Bacillota bacterium]|nr:hypothetical protein [Bacillota bacterium]